MKLVAETSHTAGQLCNVVDTEFDRMLADLECADGSDAILISHWQENPCGYQLQVTRRADRTSRICFCPFMPKGGAA